MTALMAAASRDHTGTIKALLNAGADIDAKGAKDGKTALTVAALIGNPDAVEVLLQRGSDVNARDNDGRTALSLAKWSRAKRARKDRIKEILLAAGAVP